MVAYEWYIIIFLLGLTLGLMVNFRRNWPRW